MTNATILIECPICGDIYAITVDMKGYFAWKRGVRIQTAFPKLSLVEREQLISGLCPECQKIFFGEDE